MHGTEAGPAEEGKDGLRVRLSSVKYIYIYICTYVYLYILSGVRPTEVKSNHMQGTERGTPRSTYGPYSEGASNPTDGRRWGCGMAYPEN